MIIHEVETTVESDRYRISARVSLETEGLEFQASHSNEIELWIDWPADYFTPEMQDASPFVLVCLPLAMCLRERIVAKNPISQALLLNLLEAMAIYATDFPDKGREVDLEVETYLPTPTVRARVGSFYSGGVDSFFNIAEHLRLNRAFGVTPVTDLWLIQGMDIKLTDEELWATTKNSLMSPFEADTSINCVDIRTNARAIHDRFVGWEEMGFSAILGGIAKCFSPIIGTALIGSYARYEEVVPHSSSPLVDPMWSCDRQLIRHFSCRVNRMEKLRTIIAEAPELLTDLRVCYLNPNGTYNCGRCEKCLRTQMQLMICGALEMCKRFDQPLTVESLRHLKLPWRVKNQYTWDFWHDIQKSCQIAGLDDYERAISRQLYRKKIWRSGKRLGAKILRRV